MEFRKMVMTTLYARQQKRHRCIEQSFGLCGRGRGEWFGRMALKHVLYHIQNKSPVQVECRIQEAWSCCCTGMTQRDGMGWEVGGGSGWGTRVHPWWVHFDMAKPIQYCKLKIIIIKKKKIDHWVKHLEFTGDLDRSGCKGKWEKWR